MKGKQIILVSAAVFFICSCNAQTNKVSSHKTITRTTSTKLGALAKSIDEKAATSEAFRKLGSRMDRLSLQLFGCLNELENENNYNTGDRDVLAKYYTEVDNYNALLDFAQTENDPKAVDSILSFIEDDVALKYDLDAPDPADRRARLVNVKVRVLNGDELEQSGYMVFVKPELSLDPRQVEAFNPTNNAIKEIAPGKKLIWIEKNGQRLQQRKEGIRKSREMVTVDFVLDQ